MIHSIDRSTARRRSRSAASSSPARAGSGLRRHLEVRLVQQVEGLLGLGEQLVVGRRAALRAREQRLDARRFGPLTTSRPAWLPPSGASSNRLNLLHRNETRLHTMFQRAFKNLLTLRKTAGLAREVAPIPNEPKKSRVSNKSAPAEPNSNLDLPPGEPILDTTPQGS